MRTRRLLYQRGPKTTEGEFHRSAQRSAGAPADLRECVVLFRLFTSITQIVVQVPGISPILALVHGDRACGRG